MDGIASDILQGIQVGLQSRQQRQNELARQQQQQLAKQQLGLQTQQEARRAMEDQQKYQAMFGENAVMGEGGVVDIVGSAKAQKLANDAKQLAKANAFMSALQGNPLDESIKSIPDAVSGYAEGFAKKQDQDNKIQLLTDKLNNALLQAQQRGADAAEVARIRNEGNAEVARVRAEAYKERTEADAKWQSERNDLTKQLLEVRKKLEERLGATPSPEILEHEGVFFRRSGKSLVPLSAEDTYQHKKWLRSQTNATPDLNVQPFGAPPAAAPTTRTNQIVLPSGVKLNVIQ